jgi:hypothetical protein
VAISAYVLFALEFFVRYFKDKPVGFRERRAARKHEHELQQRDTEAAGAVSPTDAFSPVDDDDDAADGAPAKPRVSPRVQMTRKIKLAMIGLAFSTLVIFIRCVLSCHYTESVLTRVAGGRSVYRTIELQDGWDGVIIHTQVYFSACSLQRPRARVLTGPPRRCVGRRDDRAGDVQPERLPPGISPGRVIPRPAGRTVASYELFPIETDCVRALACSFAIFVLRLFRTRLVVYE